MTNVTVKAGKSGLEAINAFVDGGGRLATLNEACGLATDEIETPARDHG